jgi:hypothetical protein
LSSTAIFRLTLPEARVKPERINVLVARTAANRGQRGHYPSHARGFASTSINCVHVNCNHVFFFQGILAVDDKYVEVVQHESKTTVFHKTSRFTSKLALENDGSVK